MKFSISHKDPSSYARCGIISTSHGSFETPVFMPVGTQAAVKTLTPDELRHTGTTIILSNTYHLFLRPGPETLLSSGGVHLFCGWDGPVLTDSGGFQVFSLADMTKISEDGVEFQSHLDGSFQFFTPESIIEIQKKIGADIIMPLDRPVPYPSEKIDAQTANRLSITWAKRSQDAFSGVRDFHGYAQALFGIVQGSVFTDLRKLAIEEMTALDFPGYAIGGLSVGEPKTLLYEMTGLSAALLPVDRPRYLMGVGKPDDIVTCIALGIDMFDCVMPTRVGRNGWVFTKSGRMVIKSADYKNDFSPIENDCPCYACKNFSRAYIRHLFNSGEMLGPRLATLHNISFYHRLVSEARKAIKSGTFSTWKQSVLNQYDSPSDATEDSG